MKYYKDQRSCVMFHKEKVYFSLQTIKSLTKLNNYARNPILLVRYPPSKLNLPALMLAFDIILCGVVAFMNQFRVSHDHKRYVNKLNLNLKL